MAMNGVQFQPGLSMPQFLSQYGSEAKCYRALHKARWPQGFRCPCCGGRPRSRFRREGRVYYQCRACRHQTTLISGTLFEASKVPLTTWFLAMHLVTASKTNLSALALKRHLGVCYRTAWKMKHKIMQAMTEREEGRQLGGFVQIDDAYLGGERNGGKPGRGWKTACRIGAKHRRKGCTHLTRRQAVSLKIRSAHSVNACSNTSIAFLVCSHTAPC